MSRWYRGDDEGTRRNGPRWYAASEEYAAFFGATITSVEIEESEILDLRHLGLGHEVEASDLPEGLPRYRDVETYLFVERGAVQAAAREMGYAAIRVVQWYLDFGNDEQDTLLVL